MHLDSDVFWVKFLKDKCIFFEAPSSKALAIIRQKVGGRRKDSLSLPRERNRRTENTGYLIPEVFEVFYDVYNLGIQIQSYIERAHNTKFPSFTEVLVLFAATISH